MVSTEEVRRRIEAGVMGARAEVVDTTGAGDHFEVRVTAQAVARFDAGHGLCACRTLGAASAQMQNRFAPVSQPLLNEHIDRIDFHPLSAPPKGAVRWRITSADNVDPKRLLGRRPEKIHIDVETMLVRTFAHFVQASLHHLNYGGNLDTGISAQDGNGFLTLVGWNR